MCVWACGAALLQIVQADPSHFIFPGRIRAVAKSMLHALDALQQVQVIHCDIKPDNIMLLSSPSKEDGEDQPASEAMSSYRLLDFGCSRLEKDPMFALKEVPP
eukprot:1177810-Prorocentrum_minimum.AAC.1